VRIKNLFIFLILAGTVPFIISCKTLPKDQAEMVTLKYPVVFVHGSGARDKTFGLFNHWGRIPKYLAEHGVTVHYGGADAWGSIESNAEQLKKTIAKILEEENAEKVNIIAYSKGGLDARYLISALDTDDMVASLTTIATPHHGVRAMNLTVKTPDGLYRFISFFANGWCKMFGDKTPDFFEGSRQLSAIRCSEFNELYPDKEGVYYQSYAAQMKYFFSDLAFIIWNPIIQMTDGANDGLVPVESAKWGNFRGVVMSQGIFGVSHTGIKGSLKIKYKGVDIPELHLTILKELAEQGF